MIRREGLFIGWAAACVLIAAPCHVAAADARANLPEGVWPAEQAEALEGHLDTFFAAEGVDGRKAIFDEHLAPGQVGLTLDELESMRTRTKPLGRKHGRVWRVAIPWMEGQPRSAFNLSLPRGYTPRKAWGLVVALHGSGGDVDNMIPFYTPDLNNRGFFVIYPQTTDANHYWSAAEAANVDRIIAWVARRYRIDLRRLVVTGGSMGGMGTWYFLGNSPQVWSAGGAVAGTPALRTAEQMEKLRGIPFYVLHGEADEKISVEYSRRGVAMLEKLKIAHVYVEAKGAGHTPPMAYWRAMNAWITKQPRKAWSPRPLYLSPGGKAPIWELRADPLGLADGDDPILQLIRDGEKPEALRRIGRAMAKSNETNDRAQLLVKRAVAVLPGLLDPLDPQFSSAHHTAGKGWVASNELAAARVLGQALGTRDGKGPFPDAFDAEVNLLCARIWAKRAIELRAAKKARAWVSAYNRYAHHVNAAQRLAPGHEGVRRIIAAVSKRIPKKSIQVIQVR